MHPVNDVLKVEIVKDEIDFGLQKKGVENGIVVELPEITPYIGYHSFAFESSFNADGAISRVLDKYKKLVGKRVYWTALAERGMIIKEADKTFAFIKFTDIIAFSDAKITGENVHKDGAGGFSV